MAGVLHGSVRTTQRVRAELQASKESTRFLAKQYGLTPKTVAKWRKRPTTRRWDHACGAAACSHQPKKPWSLSFDAKLCCHWMMYWGVRKTIPTLTPRSTRC